MSITAERRAEIQRRIIAGDLTVLMSLQPREQSAITFDLYIAKKQSDETGQPYPLWVRSFEAIHARLQHTSK